MLKIAITGGIGSGKTTVTDYLEIKGYTVVDADKISRELTSKNGKSIPLIREKFGDDFILPDGSMDRAKMRDLVFSNPNAKKILEECTTNLVIKEIEDIVKKSENCLEKIVFYVIPQLYENKLEKDYDKIWAVVSNLEIKKERIKKRDNVPDDIIDLIISSQAEDEILVKNSDEIIYNNESKEKLYIQIDNLLKKYI